MVRVRSRDGVPACPTVPGGRGEGEGEGIAVADMLAVWPVDARLARYLEAKATWTYRILKI